MIANLYIHKDAFQYNGTDSKEQVEQKMRALANDMRAVVYANSDENIFYVSDEALNCEVFSGVSLINAPSVFLDGDFSGIMYSMLANTAEEYEEPVEVLQTKTIYRPDEEEVNTLLYLNRSSTERDKAHYIQFDNYEIVYNQSSWIMLRRQILGNHPGTATEFIRDCRKYFCNLAIHDHCIDTLEDENYQYLNIVPRKIVYYLSCLNDGFCAVKESHTTTATDANSILEDFSGQYGLEKPGSIGRDVSKKPLLTFPFSSTADPNVKIEMLCDPHLKISQPDFSNQPVDYKSFNPRIYFHFGDTAVENGKILVGIIGKHVD